MWSEFGNNPLSEANKHGNVLTLSLVTILAFLLYFLQCKSQKSSEDSSQNVYKKLPGPGKGLLGFFNNILSLRKFESYLKTMENWCHQYGPVFIVNLGAYQHVFLNSPKYIQKLLGTNKMSYLSKGDVYEPIRPFLLDGLIMSTGDKWKFRRKVLNKHMFWPATLRGYMQVLNDESNDLIFHFGKKFADGSPHEIQTVLEKFSLDVITKVVLGKRNTDFGSTKSGEVSFTEFTDGTKKIVATRVLQPWLLFPLIWRLHPLSRVEDTLIKGIKTHVSRILTDELSTEYTSEFEQVLTGAGVDHDGVVEECITLISAGYETTSSTIHFLLFFLALHPDHQEICRNEVDSLFESMKREIETDIPFSELQRLSYIEMCVYETLRVLPTVYLITRKIEEPLELEIDLVLPVGTEVAVFLPGIHKSSKNFRNADEFIPERFSNDEKNKRLPYTFIPFTEGPRKCIGYKLAMMEIVSVTAKILRHYVISTTDKLEDVVLLPNMTITPKSPMKFIFKNRCDAC